MKYEPYVKVFKGIIDYKLSSIKWLKDNAGSEGVDWKIVPHNQEYTIVGYNGDVGVCEDLHIHIYNKAAAFQFELFKIGGSKYYK